MRALPLLLVALVACGGEGRGGSGGLKVPDVRGMAADQAQHLLAGLGLRWREGDGPAEEEAPDSRNAVAAIVTGQRPAPGAPAEEGDVVTLGEAPPAPPPVGEQRTPLFAQLFEAVRPTRDPSVVRVAVRVPPCVDVRVARTLVAGEVAIASVELALPGRRSCGAGTVRRWARARFPEPVGERAVLPGPVLRPRPADRVHDAEWERAAVASPDGRTVGVTWTSGIPACNAFAGLRVDEGDGEVRVTLRTGIPAGSDPRQACILIGVPAVALVRLREPLGPRRIVDGAG